MTTAIRLILATLFELFRKIWAILTLSHLQFGALLAETLHYSHNAGLQLRPIVY